MIITALFARDFNGPTPSQDLMGVFDTFYASEFPAVMPDFWLFAQAEIPGVGSPEEFAPHFSFKDAEENVLRPQPKPVAGALYSGEAPDIVTNVVKLSGLTIARPGTHYLHITRNSRPLRIVPFQVLRR